MHTEQPIFLPYDIRGVVPTEINNDVAKRIGSSLAELFDGIFAAGHDTRFSSPNLYESLLKGIQEGGGDVLSLGPCPNPVCYYHTWSRELSAGVYVTASHNPSNYNGFKFMKKDGSSFLEELGALKKAYSRDTTLTIPPGTRMEEPDAIGNYVDFLLSKVSIERKMKIVTDSVHGSVGLVIPQLLELLEQKAYNLSAEPKGDFGGRTPEPKGENLQELSKTIQREKADFGVGYDGDGDRSVFLDDEGKEIDGSIVSIIFARDLLKSHGKRLVIAPINSSSALKTEVEKEGGIFKEVRIGHTFIERELVASGGVFAGEPSSHFYFGTIYPFSDAILSTIILASILSRSNQKLSEIVASIPSLHLFRENVTFSSHLEKSEKMKRIVGKIRDIYSPENVSEVDGVKVYLSPTDWILIRPSNTEPKLRMTVEAESSQTAKRILSEFRTLFS